jgi:dTDP-4-amino-4,6-dideoxygalactose transaminase
MRVPFNKSPKVGNELIYIQQVLNSQVLAGDGPFSKKVQDWFGEQLPDSKVLLTSSCTAALEMAAILIGIAPGDEVIMPSYTFVSTANAFVLRGAVIKFVDVWPETMNLNENLIRQAITPRTKAIVPVHYGGVSCNMDKIMEIADEFDLYVVEDAAQAMMSLYKGQSVGSRGHFATYSFHETKNYTSGGEGGLLIVNDASKFERAEIIREKGTNRSKFFRGQVDKYTWVDLGSSYLPGELQAAHLYSQLIVAGEILSKRLSIWEHYRGGLSGLDDRGLIELQRIPENCKHNGHLFYLKCKNIEERSTLISFLREKGINAVFHYIPLHTSPAGKIFGEFVGSDDVTSGDSSRLLRLPIYYNLELSVVEEITNLINEFYNAIDDAQ